MALKSAAPGPLRKRVLIIQTRQIIKCYKCFCWSNVYTKCHKYQKIQNLLEGKDTWKLGQVDAIDMQDLISWETCSDTVWYIIIVLDVLQALLWVEMRSVRYCCHWRCLTTGGRETGHCGSPGASLSPDYPATYWSCLTWCTDQARTHLLSPKSTSTHTFSTWLLRIEVSTTLRMAVISNCI
jgi:hypothetical protein